MDGEETYIEPESQGPSHQPQPGQKKCNSRIDELATPNKRMFLNLWREHAHHFPPDKIDYLKHLLQELYAMSPEETAQYFVELQAEANALMLRKQMKQKLQKLLIGRKNKLRRQRAYSLFKKILRCFFNYAMDHDVPPLISNRLRYLSDLILEQLCELRQIELPDRDTTTDQIGMFLISIADWMAIAVERLCYAVELKKNELNETKNTLEEESEQEQKKTPEKTEKREKKASATESGNQIFKPVVASTPRESVINENDY